LSHVADQLNHGALVVGPGVRNWQELDAERQQTLLTINGALSASVIGGNPAGDPMRLLEWLANVGSRMLGGIRAGHIVTTGSMTGVVFKSTSIEVHAELVGYGSVRAAIG
jgi:2-keto-4-pentenoate hydratase